MVVIINPFTTKYFQYNIHCFEFVYPEWFTGLKGLIFLEIALEWPKQLTLEGLYISIIHAMMVGAVNILLTYSLINIIYLNIITARRKEGNVLFNDALNTIYLRLYGIRHMVKNHSDSEKGNLAAT